MKENVVNELIARRFLLGDLPVEERERMEELAFDDPETFALMQSAQDDLIDDFVNDELSSEERERFQNYFLAQPGRRQDLRIARALQQYLDREEQPVPNVATNVVVPQRRVSIFDWLRLRPATVSLVVLILVAVGLLVLILTRQTDDSPRQAQHQPTPAFPMPSGSPVETPVQASPSPTAEIQNTPAPSPRHPVEPVYAVVLVPGGPARSEGEEKVPPVSTAISFELPVLDNTPYQHYEAVLQRNGNRIRTWPNLQPKELQSGRALKVVVPAGLLVHRQRYRILVMGLTADGKSHTVHTYYFHVSN
jgi:hypothetical protein